MQAFKIFLEKLTKEEQEKCVLLLHTIPRPSGGSEMDLIQMANDYGLIPGKHVLFSAGMLPTQNMHFLYQTMDVYLQLGGMEGFCLPLIEAMACGLPIIALESSTHEELLAGTGLISKAPLFKTNKAARVTYGSYNGVECDIADPWDVADKIYTLYKDKALRASLGIKATERAVKTFDLTIVNKQWIDLIKSLIITEEQIPQEWAKLLADTKV
jgi:glycosyltransferase involved in cell wall biosynthesis